MWLVARLLELRFPKFKTDNRRSGQEGPNTLFSEPSCKYHVRNFPVLSPDAEE